MTDVNEYVRIIPVTLVCYAPVFPPPTKQGPVIVVREVDDAFVEAMPGLPEELLSAAEDADKGCVHG